jgi:phage gp36-like protein
MPYATATQLIERYDPRDIAEMASDTGIAIDDVGTDPNVLAALDDASGEVETALLQGGRYTVSDLTGLTGNSKSHLIRMTCDVAIALLFARRPLYAFERYEKARDLAEKHLDRLRKGDAVFNLSDMATASLPIVDGPTTVEYQNLNLVRDRVRNHYPRRYLPDNR